MASDIDTALAAIHAAGYLGLDGDRLLLAALKATLSEKQFQLALLQKQKQQIEWQLGVLHEELDSLNEQIEKEAANGSNSN